MYRDVTRRWRGVVLGMAARNGAPHTSIFRPQHCVLAHPRTAHYSSPRPRSYQALRGVGRGWRGTVASRVAQPLGATAPDPTCSNSLHPAPPATVEEDSLLFIPHSPNSFDRS